MNKILTDSSTTKGQISESVQRRCRSWIESFVEHTDNLDSPLLFRKWSAILTIASTLEMKVWLRTTSPIYPNLYIFIVGHPGTGKNRSIRVAKSFMAEIQDFHFAPTSVTGASLVDSLVEAKRFVQRLPDPPLEYNCLTITAEELTAFMHKYDDEMIGLLSAFYDPDPYAQSRRGKDLRIKIRHPQINILSGTTPSNLIKLMPEVAWDQGFTSRVILVFSDERIIGDDFAQDRARELSKDMVHDLQVINSLRGEFQVTEEYRTAINNWRQLGEPPQPTHPKLTHYNTRRKVHLYKLSMIAAIDRSNTLLLTKDDFNTALGWLVEAEINMPDIFKVGGVGADAKAMEEIVHFVRVSDRGKGVPEYKINAFAQERVPIHSVQRVLEVLISARRIRVISVNPTDNTRIFRVGIESQDDDSMLP